MFKRKLFIFSFLWAIHHTQASIEWMEPDKLIEINGTLGNITYDPDSQKNSWIVNVNDERGYGIEIAIDGLTVGDDEFFLLAGGGQADEDSVMIQVLTGTFKDPLYYRLPDTRSFYVRVSSSQGKFSLTYESYGEPFATYTPPTENPNPPTQKDTTYQLLLKGRPPTDFMNGTFVFLFSEVVFEIAKKYCADKNITWDDGKSVEETVFLGPILPCSPDWPDSELCTSVNHSIYVSGKELRLTRAVVDYELTSDHLKDMWDNYGGSELANIGLYIYHPPNPSNSILWWLLIIAICLVVALISLLVFWKFEHVFNRPKKEEKPADNFDGVEIRQKNKHRLSEYQNVPTYMTEPEVVLKYSKGSQRDKKPAPKPPAPKPPALTNIRDIDTSSPQQSPLSPINYSAMLYFNYNRAFVEEEEDDREIEI